MDDYNKIISQKSFAEYVANVNPFVWLGLSILLWFLSKKFESVLLFVIAMVVLVVSVYRFFRR